jgi:hypothetical protein
MLIDAVYGCREQAQRDVVLASFLATVWKRMPPQAALPNDASPPNPLWHRNPYAELIALLSRLVDAPFLLSRTRSRGDEGIIYVGEVSGLDSHRDFAFNAPETGKFWRFHRNILPRYRNYGGPGLEKSVALACVQRSLADQRRQIARD